MLNGKSWSDGLDDKLLASEEALRDTKAKIAQVKRDARKAPTLEEQSDLQISCAT